MAMETTPQSNKVFSTITSMLNEAGANFSLSHHKPIFTIQDTVEVSSHDPDQDVKTLLLRLRGSEAISKFCLLALPGSEQADFTAIARLTKAKRISMASPEQVHTNLGLEIGAVAPLGYDSPLPVIWDQRLESHATVYINPGLHDTTLGCEPVALRNACQKWADQLIMIN